MLYFSVTPETGSYVLRIRVARAMGGGAAASVTLRASVASVALLAGLVLDLDFIFDGGIRVYFVDIRVYPE